MYSEEEDLNYFEDGKIFQHYDPTGHQRHSFERFSVQVRTVLITNSLALTAFHLLPLLLSLLPQLALMLAASTLSIQNISREPNKFIVSSSFTHHIFHSIPLFDTHTLLLTVSYKIDRRPLSSCKYKITFNIISLIKIVEIDKNFDFQCHISSKRSF